MKKERSLSTERRFFSQCLWLLLPLLFLFPAMTSCSGGGIGGTGATVTSAGNLQSGGGAQTSGDLITVTSGTAGSVITSVGPITALSSIVVNGIAFTSTGATVTLAGVNSDATELKVGMVVKVEGAINADGKTGIATSVLFDPDVVGPVSGIDPGKGTIEVVGQPIVVDENTIIVGVSGDTAGMSELAVNDLVEISGLADVGGAIRATKITRKAAIGQVKVKARVGTISQISAAFQMNSLTVDFSNATLTNFGPAGIQAGDLVEVKGNLTSPTTFQADAVEKKIPDFKDGYFAVEGFIYSLSYTGSSISGFAINTPFGLQHVELYASTAYFGGQLDPIKVGAKVRVGGMVSHNIIHAQKVVFF